MLTAAFRNIIDAMDAVNTPKQETNKVKRRFDGGVPALFCKAKR